METINGKRNTGRFKSRAGGAILFVFGIIFAASVLVVGLLEYAATELVPRASSRFSQSMRLDAYSALNAAVAVLAEYESIDGGLFSIEQGWEYPLGDGRTRLLDESDVKNKADPEEYMPPAEGEAPKPPKPEIFPSGNEVVVKITDECSKLPLAALDTNALCAIFEEMGVGSSKAQAMADCLKDWTDADDATSINGAEYDDYDSMEAFPPNRPLRSLSELRYVQDFDEFFDDDGNPNELFKRFAGIVSIDNSEKVNLNSASEDVLLMMMEIEGKDYDSSLYDAIHGRIGSVSDGITWVKNSTEVTNRGARDMPSRFVQYTSSLLKIEVFVSRGVAKYYLCAYYGSQMQAVTTSESGSASNNASSKGTSNSKGTGNAKALNNKSNSTDTSKVATNAQSSSNKNNARSKNSGNNKNSSSRKLLKIIEGGR